ncbi:MAG TPA: UPF0280 family protein [Thermohalobaculum sp.]|nr:UPF0280 family protein [Thermohalobaculum sp.]
MTGPQAALLSDGRRLHLNHGPIDLIVEAWGPEAARRTAYAAATGRFATILDELVAELPQLRRPLGPPGLNGPTARRMADAVAPHAATFVTPMAAVAGAVAEEVLAALVGSDDPAPSRRRGSPFALRSPEPLLQRAYVNNGGDIALWLAPGQSLTAAIARADGLGDRLTIRHDDPVRGIATSGWRGRSHSLGIADAVTVTARSAAAADVAATLVANAVDLPGHPAVERTPAVRLDPDSDLGERPVTTGVGPLTEAEADAALAAGAERAEAMHRAGLIAGAALCLAGRIRVVGQGAALAA